VLDQEIYGGTISSTKCRRKDPTVEMTNLQAIFPISLITSDMSCLGSMRVPRDLSLETYTGWEQGFFSSAFTHAATAGKLTRHPKGFLAMWGELADRCTFPPEYLQSSEERLIDFVERGGG
jgi:hypothetical protein